ncbi:MAG: arsenate reductase ArsC [Fusobacteriota bacterium]
MNKEKILFVCIHNSARSQMAEAFIEEYAGDKYEVKSAGLTPGEMNPIVVEVMNEIGIDLSDKETNSVDEFYDNDEKFDYVITVCDEASAEECPVFPGSNQLHWGFKDPSGLSGSKEEKLKNTRIIRDQIKDKVKKWLKID